MYYLGIDVGSVSTDVVVMDEQQRLLEHHYLKTRGNPIAAVKEGLQLTGKNFCNEEIRGVGTTGSGRTLAGMIVGADLIKNEITTHGVAAAVVDPEIRTIIEIGGQDSKLILMKNGVITDFAMNTVCAAGTGSFLDRQAERLGLQVDELGAYALRAESPVRIAGRCAVFAESDIIHKQQLGCTMEDIIAGMSKALVRNYLSNVAKGKELQPKVCFQGGVAANTGICAAFSEALGCEIFVPEYHKVMGAFGAAVMVQEMMAEEKGRHTCFRGFGVGEEEIRTDSFECEGCSNQCEVVRLYRGPQPIGYFADRCGKYQTDLQQKTADQWA